MKKDSRIDIRVPAATKTLWEGYADALDYPNLSKFIEDAVEDYYQAEKAKSDFQSTLKRPTVAPPEGRGPLTQFESPIAPTKRAGGKEEFHKTNLPCPNAASHRKGAYCKTCKKVI